MKYRILNLGRQIKSGIYFRQLWVCLFVFGIGLSVGFGQDSSASETALSPEIYAIKIVGNEVTSDRLILFQMKLKPGMVYTEKTLEEDRLRIASLGLFNRVEAQVAHAKGRAIVLITVTEKLYIYPFPQLSYHLDEPEKFTWGGGIHHRNFRGQGEQLTGIAWTGYNKGYYFAHKDPWFGYSNKVSVSWRVRFQDRDLIAPNQIVYRRQELKAGFEIRRKLTLNSWTGFKFDWEEQSSKAEYYTYRSISRDRLLVAALNYFRDQRDYVYYPTQGYMLYGLLEANKLVDDSHTFYREGVDLRKYLPLGRVIFAGRFWAMSSQNHLPYYRGISLSRGLIRAGEDFGSGWMSWALNFEGRFNIIKIRYYTCTCIPYAQQYTRNMKFSVEGVVFADAGYTQYSRSDDVIKKNLWSWGCGLQFQLPYVETFHVLVGWNPNLTFRSPVIQSGVGVTF